MERASKSLKKAPSKKPKKTSDAGKITKKSKATPKPKATPKSKATPSRKVSSGKTINQKKAEAETQHTYFEDLGSRLAKRAYELYIQRGQEDGHDIEDWLEAEREILPKEIYERAEG